MPDPAPAIPKDPEAVETLARQFHLVYQNEAKRQGDVRHADDYDDLPENVKEFDRVLARYVLLNFAAPAIPKDIREDADLLRRFINDYRGDQPRAEDWGGVPDNRASAADLALTRILAWNADTVVTMLEAAERDVAAMRAQRDAAVGERDRAVELLRMLADEYGVPQENVDAGLAGRLAAEVLAPYLAPAPISGDSPPTRYTDACPTCRCDEPATVAYGNGNYGECDDPWHGGDSPACGDTITERDLEHQTFTCTKPQGHIDYHAGDGAEWNRRGARRPVGRG